MNSDRLAVELEALLAPSGVNTPWLIALLRNSTFAGSTMIDASGSSVVCDEEVDTVARPLNRRLRSGPIDELSETASEPPMMPSEKLSISISKPGLDLALPTAPQSS